MKPTQNALINQKIPLIIGNWKMHQTNAADAQLLFSGLSAAAAEAEDDNIMVAAAVPSVYLYALAFMTTSNCLLAAQNCQAADEAPLTGEVSAAMVASAGASLCLLGHSERRQWGETYPALAKRVKACLDHSITPVICVGDAAQTDDSVKIVTKQVVDVLADVDADQVAKVIIAYEPIWAISTTANRKDATAADVAPIAAAIRQTLIATFGNHGANTRIIYGGSSNETNAAMFLDIDHITGLLPGSASLKISRIGEMIRQVANK